MERKSKSPSEEVFCLSVIMKLRLPAKTPGDVFFPVESK
jgi:hypothetical protein